MVLPLSCSVNHQHWEKKPLFLFFFPPNIFWFDLRLPTIMGISTDFERESILIQDFWYEWRWVFSYVIPKLNGWSISPAVGGGNCWTANLNSRDTPRHCISDLHTLVNYWKEWRNSMHFIWTLVFVVWIKTFKYKHSLGVSLLSSPLFKCIYPLHRKH